MAVYSNEDKSLRRRQFYHQQSYAGSRAVQVKWGLVRVARFGLATPIFWVAVQELHLNRYNRDM